MRYFGTHKKIFILMGNPDPSCLTNELATAYERGAKEAGHSVKRINISDLRFDPILHHGYKVIQELEPDLRMVQKEIEHADHIVIVYPNWWCTMPALLKGLFDRMWLPGFAYRFAKDSKGHRALMPQHLLAGKTGRVIVCTGSHPFLLWAYLGDYTNEISRAILGFAGIKNKVTVFGPTENSPVWKRERWLKKVFRMGSHAY